MAAIIIFCVAIISVLVVYWKTLNRDDVEEGSTSFSLPFKIELKFKKKADKATKKDT